MPDPWTFWAYFSVQTTIDAFSPYDATYCSTRRTTSFVEGGLCACNNAEMERIVTTAAADVRPKAETTERSVAATAFRLKAEAAERSEATASAGPSGPACTARITPS